MGVDNFLQEGLELLDGLRQLGAVDGGLEQSGNDSVIVLQILSKLLSSCDSSKVVAERSHTYKMMSISDASICVSLTHRWRPG
jgi:hypothetical protein